MNPAGRRFVCGVRIQAVLTISPYDGRRASLYAVHDVTLNGTRLLFIMDDAPHSTISSSSERPRMMVEKWQVAHSELPPLIVEPPWTFVFMPRLIAGWLPSGGAPICAESDAPRSPRS